MTSISIPGSVSSLDSTAFAGCTNLTQLSVSGANRTYHSAGNCIIDTQNKALVIGCSSSVIPSDGSVTSISYGAFEGCTGLTSITIPNSVKSIEGEAFGYCTGLTSVIIPNGVTSIEGNLFAGCSNLKSVSIPTGVTLIGSGAFFECDSLTDIVIPNGVISIEYAAFQGCTGLNKLINSRKRYFNRSASV